MFLFGASGHAKVIIDILEKNNIPIDGLFDDNPNILKLQQYSCFGKFDNQIFLNKETEIIISIGDNRIRRLVSQRLEEYIPGIRFGKAIDKTAVISNNVKIEEGSVVMPGSVINTETTIGKHVIVNTSASIDHDCVIGNFVHISPNATLCGNVIIGELTHIGAGAIVLPNLSVGKNTIVGAGAVVSKSLPDNCTAVGIPAKPIKFR
jgi:acetyltransferase EpsM